ncbi:uncharacterized protein MELLADRAFT_56726 [Melampsora larici-populina 98AG31]|uniref:Uncharacterized protein n=1 Tax=Melampsora larici-populina (strain 98AG31 / pathotype 3-4-7) TaxID=747676 RepID=F4RTN4_MELLP|nr:uncharacterized protein MELLADRAFT_56726 [Melampsora larici-populina 98AG31]EGG04309.1 hypothetical protein MELLADRAFT_56726 [Melampsora larici-populina 98AG31]
MTRKWKTMKQIPRPDTGYIFNLHYTVFLPTLQTPTAYLESKEAASNFLLAYNF